MAVNVRQLFQEMKEGKRSPEEVHDILAQGFDPSENKVEVSDKVANRYKNHIETMKIARGDE